MSCAVPGVLFIGDEPFIYYRRPTLDKSATRRFRWARSENAKMRLVRQFVVDNVIEWDITDDGGRQLTVAESIGDVPVPFIAAIVNDLLGEA